MARKTMQEMIEALMRGESPGGVEVIVEEMGPDGTCPGCGQKHGEEKSKLSLDVQVTSLKDALFAHHNPPDLKVGNFVRYRSEIRYVRRSRYPHIVLWVLPSPLSIPLDNENEGSALAYRQYDTLVAAINDDGSISKFFADKRELELYPEAEAASKSHS